MTAARGEKSREHSRASLAAQPAARSFSRELSPLERELSVHEDVDDAFGELTRILPRRPIGDGRRVEDGDIRRHSVRQAAAIVEPDAGRGKRGHLADRFLEAQEPELSNIEAENAGKRARGSRMTLSRIASGVSAVARHHVPRLAGKGGTAPP